MLILRLIVALAACRIVRGDLLDLYVQHMDETMRTLAYRNRHHPRDLSSRIKRSVREEPVLKVGTFKKQRLDVDKEWYAQWKAKKRIPYKEDGLDFPNSREETLDPSQHELLENVARPQILENAARPDILENAARTEILENAARTEILENAAKTEIQENAAKTEILANAARPDILENAAKTEILENAARIEILENAARPDILENAARTEILENAARPEILENAARPEILENAARPEILENTARVAPGESEETTMTGTLGNDSSDRFEIDSPIDESPRSEFNWEAEESEKNGTSEFRESLENLGDEEWQVEIDGNSQVEIISEANEGAPKSFDDPPLKRMPKSGRIPKKYFPSMEKSRKPPRFKDVDENAERRRRSTKEPRFSRSERLDEDGDVILEWDPSDEEVVTFKVTARTLGYVGIGFNEKNHMKGADILLAWVDDHTGTVNLLDSHGIEETNAAPVTDASQDVKVLGGSQNETHTSVIFSRNWRTCDPQDHRLTGDTVRVLWALHQTDPELNTAIWHGDKRGGRALRLKTPAPHSPPRQTQDVRHWDVKLNQFPVSSNVDTIYWCKIFKAPQKEKHHMIGYTPLIEKANEDLVHHIILYECASTLPILAQYARIVGAPCYSSTMPREWESCLQPVIAWARGSKGEWLPEHVGIPIAEHRESSYYMLEVHYNNPSMKKVIDSSGVRIHYTPRLRPQEAGILVAGVAVSPLHLVPPRQREYATAGYCTPHCTNTMFPEEGVNVVSVVLHSHLAGRRLSLKHIRQGKELPRIVEDNHFDFDYQQSHTLEREVKILPGDELVAECVYGTLDRTKPTLGGYAASQEMCLAFVVHYPRTPLAACYSMTPVKDLFKTLGVYSFKGVTMDHLEKIFLTTRTEAVTVPSTGQQQFPLYPATRPSEEIDEDLIKEAKSALKAMRDYTEERENDNVFSRLIIEEPAEFRGRTLAEHMLALPWTEELLARSIESSLYHGRHMTFCRKRDDKLALPADIQMFPNYTALPEVNETSCSELRVLSGESRNSHSLPTILAAIIVTTIIVF